MSTGVSIALVDRSGRRSLFLEGGVQMFVAQVGHDAAACRARGQGAGYSKGGKGGGAAGTCGALGQGLLMLPSRDNPCSSAFSPQIAVGILLGVAFGTYNTTNLPSSITYVALVLICIFVAGEPRVP